MEFLGKIRPRRLLDRFNPELLGKMQRKDAVAVVEVVDIGEREVVALKTSTGTFIAEGFASHNSDQRPGCQFFIQIAHSLDIKTMIPKESDLMAPPMYYGIHESNHMMIKLTERLRELTQRRNNAQVVINNTQAEMHFLAGAIDDVNYMIKTWLNHEEPYVADFKTIFNGSRDQPKLKVIEGG